MSADAADVVGCAGGLIFDRVRLGWLVTVLIPAGSDSRPLQILGAEVADIDAQAVPDEHRSALLASCALLVEDGNARSEVEAALATKTTEVLMWGRALPAGLDRDGKSVTYRLSSAARAFKTQALIAAGLPIERMEPIEAYRTTCTLDLIARELDVAG